jgi:hypothetical protein
LLVDLFLNGVKVAEAEVRNVGAFAVVVVAVLTLGLEFAEFGGAFVEEAMSQGTGAVYGELKAGSGFFLHRVLLCRAGVEGDEILFDLAAAAETPHGTADFVGEVEFERADGSEAFLEVLGEFGIGVLFVGADKVTGGKEAEGDGVLGGGCFTGICMRPATVGFFGGGYGCGDAG